MDEADVIVARAFADLAAISIIQHRAAPRPSASTSSSPARWTSRVVIEQAKGVISERAGVDLAEAFSRLRRYARNHNLRLTDVAQAAIDGTLDPPAWAPARPSRQHGQLTGFPAPGPGELNATLKGTACR